MLLTFLALRETATDGLAAGKAPLVSSIISRPPKVDLVLKISKYEALQQITYCFRTTPQKLRPLLESDRC